MESASAVKTSVTISEGQPEPAELSQSFEHHFKKDEWPSLPLRPRVEGGVIDMSFITRGSAFHCTFGDSRDPILC